MTANKLIYAFDFESQTIMRSEVTFELLFKSIFINPNKTSCVHISSTTNYY